VCGDALQHARQAMNVCRTCRAIKRSGDPAIRRSGDPAIRRSGDPATQRSTGKRQTGRSAA
jgi:hypothetical protein